MTTKALEFLESVSLRPKDSNSGLKRVQPETISLPTSTHFGKVEHGYGHDFNRLSDGSPVSPISPLRRETSHTETTSFDDRSEEASRTLNTLLITGESGVSGESPSKLRAVPSPLSDERWRNWSRSRADEQSSSIERAVDRAGALHADAGLPLHEAHRQALVETFAHLSDIYPGIAARATDWVVGGCPITDSLAAVGLQGMDRPHDWPSRRWGLFQDDALSFAESWAKTAALAGWQTWELWGCHRQAPFRRINGLGLIAMITGARLTKVDSVAATITAINGSALRYRRKGADPLGPSERVMVWQVAVAKDG